MKVTFICILLMALGIRGLNLPPPERQYKILMLLPVSSKSHRNVFMPLANALADRGHKIVMLSNNDKPSKHPNIYEMHHTLKSFNESTINMFETRKKGDGGFSVFLVRLPTMARDLYKVPKIKELYEKKKKFDLVVTDHMFNEVVYPFAFEMPFMTVATAFDFRQSAMLGNPISPSYIKGFSPKSDISTVFGRMINAFQQLSFAVYWRIWMIVPAIQKEISVHFPDHPPLLEIERNQSLTLVNSHFSMDTALPLLPSQIEVGTMHCRPAEPLPEDIKSWIEGAGPSGVIYFSLGSIVHANTIPVKYRDMFIEAFKMMDQRILWKSEIDIEGISENVKISRWLPQQDVLAHPNVKVFITHGGLLSLQESSYHGTPLLALPIFGDQPKNGGLIQDNGQGISLVWEELTVDLIVKSLREIINNPKYSQNAATISRLLKDQLTSPLERAVFWTEYVIRHQGAPQLKSPAAKLSWIEFLLLDALVVLILIIAVFLFLVRLILKKIFRAIFGKKNKNKRD